MASVGEVRSLMVATTVPQVVVDDLFDHASALWLMSAPASHLAGDLVLCHPPIGPLEVRAVAHPLEGGAVRLTVVARDRPGLLADTTWLLAAHELSVASASAMSWPDSGTALHALTIDRWRLTEDLWRELGEQLRRLGQEGQPTVTFTPVTFTPVGRAVVTSSPSAMGRSVVTVTAPDQVGVLWAICRWFADHDVSIEAASVGASDGQVEDHFVVVGQPDTRALAARLSEPGGSLMSAAVGVAKGVVRRLVPS